jgi:prepilin-type N-terminal cleavage/methylation domain-containing protein
VRQTNPAKEINDMRSPLRSGFTLVELLVVITIIGILISMLMPAVNASRETARRTDCSRNLMRIGAALQAYEDANTVYPPGTVNAEGPIHNVAQGNHLGWLTAILPYLDEKVISDHIDVNAGVYDPKNADVRAIRLSRFLCPSDVDNLPANVGASAYAGCHNDVEAAIDADNHGVFFLNSKIAPKDVTDGLSHTLFVGEKRIDRTDPGWMSGTRATLRNAGTPINGTPIIVDLPAEVGADAAKTAPAAAASGTDSDLWVGGFGSAHPMGTQFLLGDGSIRFINRSISDKVFQLLANRADGEMITEGPTRE